MIPQINVINNSNLKITPYPSNTYKYSENHIIGKVDKAEAIQQAILHILSIERYDYLIYSDNYGVEFRKYIGKDIEYFKSTIEQTLKDALLQDDRIINVEVTEINQNSIDSVSCNFIVYYNEGNLEMEVTINV